MAKRKKSNPLLSSLEEIKKGNEEEIPSEPGAAPAARPAPETRSSSVSSGLLNSLLSEVKAEAEREVQEITRTLEEKTVQERQLRDDDERRKKDQYDKLIQEEAKRRLDLIKRKEDDKKRAEAEKRLREKQRLEAAALQVRQKKRKKVLLGVSGVGLVVAAVAVVLVMTGVIPLGNETEENSAPEVAGKVEKKVEVKSPKVKKEEPKGPPIGDPTEELALGIDGPAGEVLDIPERANFDKFRFVPKPPPAKAPNIETGKMRVQLAKAFRRHSSSSGGSTGGSSGSTDSGGIQIDTSIFKD